ncbi:MAG: MerR family transcriptional regulator [Bacillota bacterium]|nr:MerR family transcriptional regulator [Bacillota bacterium]
MKIGDFARKYGLNITTVRYYVDKALLTPERKNNQYIFNRSCMEDMEKILKYKEYRFSLEEIELLFFLEKTSKFRDETVLQIISQLLAQKKAELQREQQSVLKAIKKLDLEIENFSTMTPKESDEEDRNGLPFSFLPYLYCPKCKTPLRLESASIANNKLTKGELLCDCGYQAEINDGVILCEGHSESTPFKAFDNIRSVSAITEEFSNEYRILIDKTYLWMYHNLPESTQPQNILAGPFSFNFLLKYCQRFPDSATFIVVDPSLKRIAKLQSYMKEFDFQTVYIAGNMDAVPLREACADIYIDDFSATNCIFTYNRSKYRFIAPLLKKGCIIAGIFAEYNKAPKSLANFKEDHPDFLPEKMTFSHLKADMKSVGINLTERKEIGSTTGNEKHFQRHLPGEQISVLGYKAIKERKT